MTRNRASYRRDEDGCVKTIGPGRPVFKGIHVSATHPHGFGSCVSTQLRECPWMRAVYGNVAKPACRKFASNVRALRNPRFSMRTKEGQSVNDHRLSDRRTQSFQAAAKAYSDIYRRPYRRRSRLRASVGPASNTRDVS